MACYSLESTDISVYMINRKLRIILELLIVVCLKTIFQIMVRLWPATYSLLQSARKGSKIDLQNCSKLHGCKIRKHYIICELDEC